MTDSSAAWHVVANAAGIEVGSVLLDVGCGAGAFCAQAVTWGVAAHGLDADRDRIEQARRRAPEAELRVGLMEALPWPDDTFDVVTGFNAFQYAVDVDAALAEARRVTQPGGRIAICKWAPPEHNELFALIDGLRGRELGRVADPIDAAVRRTELATRAAGDVPVAIELRDDVALEAALAAAGALPGGGEGRLAAAAAPFRRPDGSYRFANRYSYRILQA